VAGGPLPLADAQAVAPVALRLHGHVGDRPRHAQQRHALLDLLLAHNKGQVVYLRAATKPLVSDIDVRQPPLARPRCDRAEAGAGVTAVPAHATPALLRTCAGGPRWAARRPAPPSISLLTHPARACCARDRRVRTSLGSTCPDATRPTQALSAQANGWSDAVRQQPTLTVQARAPGSADCKQGVER